LTTSDVQASPSSPSESVPSLNDVGIEADFDEGTLRFREVVRAFHAREDLERLGRLARRFFGARRVPPADTEWTRPVAPGTIDDLLGRRDDQLDLARAALLVAREDEPGIDGARALERLDRAAHQLKARLAAAGPEPFARLGAMNAFVFGESAYGTDAALDPRGRLRALYLPTVLEQRRGHCLGLSVLYLALGARTGMPLFGVSCPGHFFVRYDDGRGTRVNVETTARGATFPDGWYVERYKLSAQHVDRGVYLGNLAKREVLVEVLNNRANCYWDLGDATRAARDLDRVARASASFAPGHAGRGFVALQRGDLPRAVAELRKAIEVDPAYARAYLHLGDALLRAGQVDRADEALRKAVELDPASALAHTNLGRVHVRRSQVSDAIAMHLRALELDPRCHVAWNNLGVARRAAGDVREAARDFRRALALAPRFLAALENLALVSRGPGVLGVRAALARRAAIAGFEQKLARSPLDAGLHATYARFLCEVQGDALKAAYLAERACELAPDSPRAWEALALVAKRAGDTARAVKLLERAVALAPLHAGAEQPRLKGLLESTRLRRAR
jgi:tetratricopeptide (TPR) repeat protein